MMLLCIHVITGCLVLIFSFRKICGMTYIAIRNIQIPTYNFIEVSFTVIYGLPRHYPIISYILAFLYMSSSSSMTRRLVKFLINISSGFVFIKFTNKKIRLFCGEIVYF